MARPVTFAPGNPPASPAALDTWHERLNAMQDGVLSYLAADIGTSGAPATGGALTIAPDLLVSSVQRFAWTVTIYAGGNTAITTPANVPAGSEAWVTVHFRQVAGPWTFTVFGWTVVTQGGTGVAASTTAGAWDTFEFYTPNGGTDWQASVSQAWA